MHGYSKILVTGADGFIGKAVINALNKKGVTIVKSGRRKSLVSKDYFYREISGETSWDDVLNKVDSVIHLGGRAHILNDGKNSAAEYMDTNFHGTKNLALQAAKKGVKKFIFISSIGVNGRLTKDKPFTELSELNPDSPYSLSKMLAEKELRAIEKDTGMEVVIIRPPLVYGAGAKGNFPRLIKLVKTSLPLPFKYVSNKRSFVSVTNLVSGILHCLTHEKTGGETFLISDGKDLSTGELVKIIGEKLDKKVWLIYFPLFFIKFCLENLGRKNIYESLFCSLEVDCSKLRDEFLWTPVSKIDLEIEKTIDWYLTNNQ